MTTARNCEIVSNYSPSRTPLTQGRHVHAQIGTSVSTGSLFRLGLLWLLRMSASQAVFLGGVAMPLNHPLILPQAMTVCQWLLRMSLE